MVTILAKNIGFCFGVKRALSLILKALKENPGRTIYTLGPLIHNPPVIRDLERRGVRVIHSASAAKKGIFVIPSHGLSPEVVKKAKANGAAILDATCPYVLRSQKIATGLVKDGYRVVVVGEKFHPEIKGIMGRLGKNAGIVSSAADLKGIPRAGKIGVIAQTTESLGKFREIVSLLLEKSPELKVCNTLCVHTMNRQEEAVRLAGKVDAMIIVGGRNSANTRRLFELCSSAVPSFHIESAGELGRVEGKLGKLKNVPGRGKKVCGPRGRTRVGIVSGTSTPDNSIMELVGRLKEV